MSENYLGIITENYHLTLHGTSHGKVEIYRDTGVSKNHRYISMLIDFSSDETK